MVVAQPGFQAVVTCVLGKDVGDHVVAVVQRKRVLEGGRDVGAQGGVLLDGVHVGGLDGIRRVRFQSEPSALFLHDLHHAAAEDLQQERLVGTESQHPVDEVCVVELEAESSHRMHDEIRRELWGEWADDGRCLRQVAERPVSGQPGEALHRVQTCEDHFGPAPGRIAQAAQSAGLGAFRHIGFEEPVALVEQDQQSAVGIGVEPPGDAVGDSLVWLGLGTAPAGRFEDAAAGEFPVESGPDRVGALGGATADADLVEVEVELAVGGALFFEAVSGIGQQGRLSQPPAAVEDLRALRVDDALAFPVPAVEHLPADLAALLLDVRVHRGERQHGLAGGVDAPVAVCRQYASAASSTTMTGLPSRSPAANSVLVRWSMVPKWTTSRLFSLGS